MDGFELFQLGRRLMKLGEQSIPEVGILRLSGPTRAVVFDVFENPGSSISEITARVQFPQSQISACVARLREAGVVETISDPEDRRRTLVQPTADARDRARHRPVAKIDQAIITAIGTSDPSEVQRVKDALDAVADLLRRDDHDGASAASHGQAEP